MKKKLISLCFALLSLQTWASNDFPVTQGTIDPPPETAPIDSFLPLAMFIAIVMVGYYFNKKKLLNNK